MWAFCKRQRLRVAMALAFLIPAVDFATDLIETDFEQGSFAPWMPLASGTWQIQEQAGNHIAALTVAGADRPPVRRPRAYLFLPDHSWKDCTFTVRAKTLEAASLSFRDVVLIFGYIDDTHYYYAHTSSRSDSTHSVIMKVDGDQRGTIHLETNHPPALNGNWQVIRVEHASSGLIRVFVDDLVTPRLTAQDTDYLAGAVAFGCFDDRALFDDVSVSGTLVPLPSPQLGLAWSAANEVTLRYPMQQGFSYQLLEGTELATLKPSGPPVTGHPGVEEILFNTVDIPQRFFSVVTTHPLLAK